MPTPACGPGTSRGSYTNDTISADLDGDGNLDLVIANGGGHFTPGNAEPQLVYLGDGHGPIRLAGGLRARRPSSAATCSAPSSLRFSPARP